MLDQLKKIFGMGPKTDLEAVLANGAIIIDVRSKEEYAGGHLNRSVNIPLDKLQEQLPRLNRAQPVITCCASGMRSASAKSILLRNDFTEVHNGGSWLSLRKYDK